MRSLQSRTSRFVGVLLALGMAAGCGNIEPVAPHEPVTDPTQLYMQLTLDHPAVNLSTVAPYNTVQLTATPRDASGNPMPGLPVPTFRSTDTTKVRVTADGVVTAVGTVTGALVIAELVIDGPVRRADTAVINVKDLVTPPVLDTLSIHPVPPDSAIRALGAGLDFASLFTGIEVNVPPNVRVRDAGGNPITGLVIEYASLDPAVATIDRRSGFVSTHRVGQVRFAVRTTAYGITKADTAAFTVTWPLHQEVDFLTEGHFAPSEVRIAPHGVVSWFTIRDSVDVIFDDPTNIAESPPDLCFFFDLFLGAMSCGLSGHVFVPARRPEFDYYGTTQSRQFPVPGVYPYRSMLTGATGRVIVSVE